MGGRGARSGHLRWPDHRWTHETMVLDDRVTDVVLRASRVVRQSRTRAVMVHLCKHTKKTVVLFFATDPDFRHAHRADGDKDMWDARSVSDNHLLPVVD